MALPKEKVREPKVRSTRESFDPTWNRRAGTVDTVEKYVEAACREPKGFFRGARIK